MDKCPFFELENQVVWIAVIPVLGLCILPGLAGHRVLEFERCQRKPVEPEDDVDGILMLWRIAELAGDGEDILIIEPERLRVEAACRPEICDTEELPERFETVAENGEAAFVL